MDLRGVDGCPMKSNACNCQQSDQAQKHDEQNSQQNIGSVDHKMFSVNNYPTSLGIRVIFVEGIYSVSLR